MRGSRTGGGLEARTRTPPRTPARVSLTPAPCGVLITRCLSPLGAQLREARPRVAAGARRGRGRLAQPLSRLRAGTRDGVCTPCPCPQCITNACTCTHAHAQGLHMHAHTSTQVEYTPPAPYAVHPRALVAELPRGLLPLRDAAADRGALRGLHPTAVERHHKGHHHRTPEVPEGDARTALDRPAHCRRQGAHSSRRKSHLLGVAVAVGGRRACNPAQSRLQRRAVRGASLRTQAATPCHRCLSSRSMTGVRRSSGWA